MKEPCDYILNCFIENSLFLHFFVILRFKKSVFGRLIEIRINDNIKII